MYRQGRLPVGPGGRGAARHLAGADPLRTRAARRREVSRLPDPRQPHGRAQEVRQGKGPPQLPVLEALTAFSADGWRREGRSGNGPPFFVTAGRGFPAPTLAAPGVRPPRRTSRRRPPSSEARRVGKEGGR